VSGSWLIGSAIYQEFEILPRIAWSVKFRSETASQSSGGTRP